MCYGDGNVFIIVVLNFICVMEMRKFLVFAFSLALVATVAKSIEFSKTELKTDESLWNLYKRWRSHHTVYRNLTEKRTCFNVCKLNIMHIHRVNKKSKPYKLQLNKFANMSTRGSRTLLDQKLSIIGVFVEVA